MLICGGCGYKTMVACNAKVQQNVVIYLDIKPSNNLSKDSRNREMMVVMLS